MVLEEEAKVRGGGKQQGSGRDGRECQVGWDGIEEGCLEGMVRRKGGCEKSISTHHIISISPSSLGSFPTKSWEHRGES